MGDLWGSAINEAVGHDTLLRASELDVHMVVQHVKGQKIWRVIECLSPDGFPKQGIVRMVDEKGYDDTWLYEHGGKMNDPVWKLIGIAEQ